jgi:hypothetical protein
MDFFRKALPLLIIIAAFALVATVVWYWFEFEIQKLS